MGSMIMPDSPKKGLGESFLFNKTLIRIFLEDSTNVVPNNSTATAVELLYLHQLGLALKREAPSTSLGWRLDPGAMVGNSKMKYLSLNEEMS